MTNPANGWLYVGQRNGKPHYKYTGTQQTPAHKELDSPPAARTESFKPRLPLLTLTEVLALKPGDKCPKCRGTGTYRWHDLSRRRERSSTCYWCTGSSSCGLGHGKGWVDLKDLMYVFAAASDGRLNVTISA